MTMLTERTLATAADTAHEHARSDVRCRDHQRQGLRIPARSWPAPFALRCGGKNAAGTISLAVVSNLLASDDQSVWCRLPVVEQRGQRIHCAASDVYRMDRGLRSWRVFGVCLPLCPN